MLSIEHEAARQHLPLPARAKIIVKRTGLKKRRRPDPRVRSYLSAEIISPGRIMLKRQINPQVQKKSKKNHSPCTTTVNSADESVFDRPAAESRLAAFVPEGERLASKVGKVVTYWSQATLMIPNVFRLTSLIEFNNQSVMEYQDLSLKEVLAQNGGLKGRGEAEERREERGGAEGGRRDRAK